MNWWHYLLLVNLYLVLFYGFYTLLLRRETFFQLNRIYLVSAALLSFLIPVIQSNWVNGLFITEQVHYTIYSSPVMIYAAAPIEKTPLTIGQVFIFLYLGGIAFLTIKFILQLIKVKKIINEPEPSAAYSFFKKISLGENVVKQDAIIAHEQVHARQWHTVDVLIIEIVMIINWFNPVVYLYRFAIKHIHEFIADQQALKVGADKAEYALLLLSQTFNAPSHQLVNPFYNQSLLKQRIMMIQKNRSQRIVLFKYMLSAPLFGLMLILSSATVNNSKAIRTISTHANNMFVKPVVATIEGVADNGQIPDELTSTPFNTSVKQANGNSAVWQQDKVYEAVDKEPQFPGGLKAFYKFLAKTVRYPADARVNNIQGRVYVQFIVEKDGSLSSVKVVRGPGHGLNEEAARAVKSSPKWIPGTQHGKAVRVQYTVPINFTLAANKPTASAIVHPDNNVYESVETEPAFPGGIQEFYNFLSKTIKYPAEMREKKVQGKVYVQFVVEEDGSLSDIKAIRGPGSGSEEEAVKAISLSPKWNPGIQNGKTVRVQYTVPVNFALADNVISVTIKNPVVPIYVVDGVEADINTMKKIKADDIKSINVIKDKSAKALYGDRGVNGVVSITTKKQ
ncbi:MAG: TonB family protein [Mucilaginibacter sp.]|nr:TonB family protein [Mucilaginibacter sp.]